MITLEYELRFVQILQFAIQKDWDMIGKNAKRRMKKEKVGGGWRESKKEWRKDEMMKEKSKWSQDDEMKLEEGKKGRNVLS